MDETKSTQHSKNETLRQSAMCPWIAAQPHPSSLTNKNRNGGQKRNPNIQTNSCLNNYWNNGGTQGDSPKQIEKTTFSSMQQSSSQFFHFLRLMQLFPHTHPATLHTVLYLCKNDFFCAVDKLLYAKRCRMLYNNRRNQMNQQRNSGKCHSSNPNNFTPQKRTSSKCQMNGDNVGREVKLAKVSGSCSDNSSKNISPKEINNCKQNSPGDFEKITSTDPDVTVEPIGTIKFITIKASNIQGAKVNPSFENITEHKKVEVKVDEEL